MSPTLDTPRRGLEPRQQRQAAFALAAIGLLLLGLITSVTRPSRSIAFDHTGFNAPNAAALPREDSPPDTNGQVRSGQPVVVTVPVQVPVAVPVSGPVQRILVPVATQSGARGIVIEPRPANGAAAPEVTRFYVETENPSAKEATRFRWWAGDADGQLRGFTVDFGDGREARDLGPDRCMAQPSDPVQERPPFDHVYDQPGHYTVVITVYSAGSCGNGPTQSASATVELDVGVLGVSAPVPTS